MPLFLKNLITRVPAAGACLLCVLGSARIDAAQAPTAILPAEAALPEHSPADTLVATLSAVDPDSPDNHVFELVDGPGDDDNGIFYLSDNELWLEDYADVDYEEYPDAFWSVRIKVTDATGLDFTTVMLIRIADDRGEDHDQDGLTEAEEEDDHGTSDLLYDSDGDGVGDAAEIAIGTSPVNPDDWPQTSLLGWGRRKDGELAVPGNGGLSALATGQFHSLALDHNGVVTGWGGFNDYDQITPPDDLADVIDLAAGGDHWLDDTSFSLALKRDGTVVEWGYDKNGSVEVPGGLDRVVAVAAGRCVRMALRDDGTVVTWGEDPFGNIGPPGGLSDVVAVAAGGYRCLALKGDGTVVEWGMNFDGEKWHEAAAPAGMRDIVAISAGRFHSLALRSDGTVAAWGYGLNGQTAVPTDLGGVVAVSAGGFHSLALKADGGVVAWGLNSDGQCNVPSSANQQVRLISAGIQHSLAARQDLGYPQIVSSPRIDGSPGTPLEHQVQVADPGNAGLVFSAIGLPPGLSIHPATGVISGTVSTAVRRSVLIRVFTQYGLLTQAAWISVTEGSPPQSLALSPAELRENSPAGTVVGTLLAEDPDEGDALAFEWADGPGSRDNHLFRIEGDQLILRDDLAKDFEQDPTEFSIRVRVLDSSLNSHEEVIALDFLDDRGEDADGDGLTQEEEEAYLTSDLLIDSDGDGFSDRFEITRGPSPLSSDSTPGGRLMMEWGGEPMLAGATPLDGGDVIEVAAGGAHSLALRSDGTVHCLGADDAGQSTPPEGLQDVIAVSAGRLHSMALKRDGTVVAWGDNSASQCEVPEGLSGVVAIAAGAYHSLALRLDGQVIAWGYDAYGQADVPVSLGHVVEISAGGFHSLALRDDGTVVAWGSDWRGINQVPEGLEGVTGIAAGGYHSLALRHDGTVVAWGDWEWGQTSVPSGMPGAVGIAAGWRHNLALHADGSLTTWGDSLGGRLEIPLEARNVRRIAAGESHNLAVRQDAGFPGFAEIPPIKGWPGRMLGMTFAMQNAQPSAFSAMGLPDDLTLDAQTGILSGLVVAARRRAARIMVDTDQGPLSRVFWVDTGAGLPPVQITLDQTTVLENAPAGTLIGVLGVSDPDAGDSHVIQMGFGTGAPDSYRFVVVGNHLLTREAMSADFEDGDPRLFIRISAVDSGGNAYSQDMVIDLLDDRTEDDDGDGASEAMEEDVFGTSDRVFADFTTADPDKDGIPSLIEHAFNMNPRTPGPLLRMEPGAGSTSGLPGISLVQAGPLHFRLRMEYVRRIDGGLRYTPQFSGGLHPENWVDASPSVVVTPIDSVWERCIVEDAVTTETGVRRFGRVAVEFAQAVSPSDDDNDGINRELEETLFGTSDQVFDDFRTHDIDADGVPGMIEYAFNLDPVNPGPPVILGADPLAMTGLPSITLERDTEGEPRLRIEFIRRTDGWLTYRAQFAGDLAAGDWTSADETDLEIETISPGWQRCVAWDSVPQTAQSQRFGRVAVSW
jgi:alpha-tubulin suppressor-like RCC1 family protein